MFIYTGLWQIEDSYTWWEIKDLEPEVHHEVVIDWLTKSCLVELQLTPLKVINHELISALVERWLLGTSSFHLPFSEMTITTDDVSNLLHLPLTGSFFTSPDMFNSDTSIEEGMELLGIPQLDCVVNTNKTRGPYFRFMFLENAYATHLQLGNFAFLHEHT